MKALQPAVLAAILLGSLVVLGAGISKSKVAAAFSDPVSHIRAQDESIYANASITMALKGGWLTPRVLGRIFLFKPPLPLWLSGLSMKLLGISLAALRLPMWIAGSLGAVLIFCWCSRAGFWAPGFAAVLLLLSDPIWHTFSRLCYTDMLLAVFTLAALYCIIRDPLLATRSAFIGFCAATAAAVMCKSVGGVVPILVLLLIAVCGPRGNRPALLRVVQACLVTALFIAPWHVYQLIMHPRWFWADYVQLELLRIGLQPADRATQEFPLWFYGRRLFLVDPFLCILALVAVPGLFIALHRRNSIQPVVLASWLIVVIAAMCVFQTRFFHYLVILIAPLCILAACYGPLASPRFQRWIIAALCVVFGIKSFAQGQIWSLSFGRGTPMPAASILRSYSDLTRPNSLVLVQADDDFYAATLPLPNIHYCYVDPGGMVARSVPYYVPLGITVSADQFDELDKWEPQFRAKLREWGLDSGEPIATAVVAQSDADVVRIIQTHPSDDFYLPARFRGGVTPLVRETHEISQVSRDRIMLFARSTPQNAPPRPTAHWSGNW